MALVNMLLHIGLANAVLATVLALVAWAVGRVARRPALTHALWLLVLLKLVTPPLWNIRVPWPAAGHILPSASSADSSEADQVGSPDLAFSEQVDVEDATAGPGLEPSRIPVPPEILDRTPRLPRTPAAATRRWLSLWKPALVALWVTGALVFWSVAAYRVGWLRQLLRGAQRAPAELQAQVRRLADRLHVSQCPDVWLVPVPIPPMLWAVLGRPRLLLPSALWERLSEEQRETLLTHELVHLRGRDHWVRRLELVTLGLYWWHPVAWWARRELREAEEQRCDAWVVGALPDLAAAYAQTLLDTVAFLSRARCAAPLGASSMGQVRVLKRRLTMILQGTTSRTRSQTYWWVALGLGAFLLPLMPTWAEPPRERAADKNAAKNLYGKSVEQAALAWLDDDNQIQARGGLALNEQERPRRDAGDELEARLQQLEKQLEALRKEIQMLRRERGVARTTTRRISIIDLQPWANQKLDETFHSEQYPGNNLASLPAGRQNLAGMPFAIGKGLIQLGSRIDKPDKVEGIKVNRKLGKLHILHATGYSADDNAQIGEYTIYYEDGTSTTIPIVYGKDVLDWWKYPDSGEPTRGQVVWNGENEPAKREFDATIRLYMTTWENPKPDLRITHIDYSTNNETNCLPFCVAMTAED